MKDGAVTGARRVEWALGYARLGWSVIPVHTPVGDRCSCGAVPCRSPGKHPRVRWEAAMTDPASVEQIESWWLRWPDANVGVVTGLGSGVAVLDIDPRSGGDRAFRFLTDRYGMVPITPEVHTGGGGLHLWFGVDSELPSVTLAPGVELKAESGMVVAPPSRHASGASYRWRPGGEPDALALASLPTWISDLAGAGPALDVEPSDLEVVRTTLEQEEFAETWDRAGVELLPGDRYYRCPFHDDHNPSLHIDAEGCRWYCFGCGIGGGIGRLRGLLGETGRSRPRGRLRGHARRGLPVTIHGVHETEVVGESHHQDELLAITGGRRRYGGVDVGVVAELVPEPDNRFDPDAIAVEIDDRVVGYVRREDVEWLRPLIDDSLDMHGLATCEATIRGGWDRGRDEIGWFGVTLLLPAE